jgi:hypothetical protein
MQKENYKNAADETKRNRSIVKRYIGTIYEQQ